MNKSKKISDKCRHCARDTSQIKMRALSSKFNAWFCDQKCYEDYRKSLDKNWDDKPVEVSGSNS